MRIIFIIVYLSSFLFALNISSSGLLDDDIFIYSIQEGKDSHSMIVAEQMHNPRNEIIFNGQVNKTKPINGEVSVDIEVKNTGKLVVVSLANEREEINPSYTLNQRTHYRSPGVFLNKKVFLKRYLPSEYEDDWFPKWFLSGVVSSCSSDSSREEQSDDVDYFMIWENAIVQLGLIFPEPGEYIIYYIKEGHSNPLYKKKVVVLKNTPKVVKIHEKMHDFVEGDGYLYKTNKSRINKKKRIRNHSITKLIIVSKQNSSKYIVPLVYPWPYLNQLVISSF